MDQTDLEIVCRRFLRTVLSSQFHTTGVQTVANVTNTGKIVFLLPRGIYLTPSTEWSVFRDPKKVSVRPTQLRDIWRVVDYTPPTGHTPVCPSSSILVVDRQSALGVLLVGI